MKARRAVGDDADTQAVIRTVHGHGYRFVAELRDDDVAIAAATPEPAAPVSDNSPLRRAAIVCDRRYCRRRARMVVRDTASSQWTDTPGGVAGRECDGRFAVGLGRDRFHGADVTYASRTAAYPSSAAAEFPGSPAIHQSMSCWTLNRNFARDSGKRLATRTCSARALEFDQGLYRHTYTYASESGRPVVAQVRRPGTRPS